MITYRIPGSLGHDIAKSRDAWARSVLNDLYGKRTEFLRRCRPGPLGCYSLDVDPNLSTNEEDRVRSEPEFRMLRPFSVKGVGDGKGQRFRDLDDYIEFRNAFFGSAESYWEFALASDRELDANEEALRKQLDNPWRKKRTSTHPGHWYYYFYRWVRKAYLKSGVEQSKVVSAVTSGMSPALLVKLASVKAEYKAAAPQSGSFRAGGFNPRPKKTPYKLGTLSEHADGRAVDIESGRNPDLPRRTWQKIKDFTEKQQIDRSESRWRSNPKGLWDDIRELNQLYVEKMKRGAEAAWAKAQIDKSAGAKDSRSEAEVKNQFKRETARSLGLSTDYIDGFFTLDWELVNAFHNHNFLWGATFPTHVDLHHFEL